MNYSIKLSEIFNNFRIMVCISPQYVSYISSPLLLQRKKELGEREEGGEGRRGKADPGSPYSRCVL